MGAFELDATVVVGSADVEGSDVAMWPEVVLVDAVNDEDTRWLEIMELDDTVDCEIVNCEVVDCEVVGCEVVTGTEPTAFAATIELSATVVPFQTT
jgi:hypothetical protein